MRKSLSKRSRAALQHSLFFDSIGHNHNTFGGAPNLVFVGGGFSGAMQIRSFILLLLASAWLTGCSQGAILGPGGSGTSALTKLVPAEQLESSAGEQYKQLLGKAQNSGTLARDSDTQLQRLRGIANRIIPHAARYNARASTWQWEINLVRSANINAFCMPGGKIAFYSGLLEQLKLTDDEVGVIMGHEIAHALREHARAQIAKNTLTNAGADAATTVTGNSTSTVIKTGAQTSLTQILA